MKHRESLRILHFLAPAHAGGIESVVHGLTTGQSRTHSVRVVASLDRPEEPHPFVQALEKTGIEVVSVRASGRRYRREMKVMEAALREFRPDIVHTHGYRAGVLACGFKVRAHAALVTTLHGFTGNDSKNRLYEQIQRWTLRFYDAVFAVSQPLADSVRQYTRAGTLHVVPNAWTGAPPLTREDARAALGLPPQGFHVGWIGRFSPEKDPITLMRAAALIAPENVRISMIGDGALAHDVCRLARSLPDDMVTLHGLVPEAGRYMAAFDAFVLTSRTEGTPIVLFEAMAAGVPIIATRVGGVEDVTTSGGALLVSPGDPASIAAAIRSIACDPHEARSRATIARGRLDRVYGAQPWLEAHEHIYSRLVSVSNTDVSA